VWSGGKPAPTQHRAREHPLYPRILLAYDASQLEALDDGSRQYQPGVTPPPPPAVCVYIGTGLYILNTTARFQRPY
jgi:hypothetical protein